jgi:predicted chitinase
MAINILNFKQFINESLETQTEIIDISDESVYPRKGEPIKSNEFFIIHHTAGLGDAHGVVRTLNTRKNKAGQTIKLGVQWVVDRDGTIYKTLPSNSRGAHVGASDGYRGAPPGISNSNAQGVEVIAKNDADIQMPEQGIAVLKIIKHLGYTKNQIFGHGEVNPGHKAATEGATIKQYVMDHFDDPIDLSVFDKETTADIARPSSNTANGNPVINSELIKKLITALKAKNFSNDDIKLTSNPKATSTGPQSTGNIDISAGNFSAEQKENISYLINAMTDKGITDSLTQIGILSVISKECNFIPKSEAPYDTTSNSSIRNKFNDRVNDLTKQKISDLSETELDELKRNPEDFFNWVYGNMIGNGSVASGDGYLYRGRGFNQLTGRANYKKYGDRIGEDLVGNPDKVNDVDIAAKIAIEFATKGKPASSFPTFTDKTDAAEFFADINAGGTASSHRSNAVAASNKFNIA